MTIRRSLALALAGLLAAGSAPALLAAAQDTGLLSGRATARAQAPYTNYQIQLRDPVTAQIIRTERLDDRGQFNIAALPLSRRYLLELFSVRENRVICTDGPFELTRNSPQRSNLNVCGSNPSALWLLLAGAGAGAAASIAVLKQSGG
jgi:hypothetical protein